MTNQLDRENCVKCNKQVTGKQNNLECNQCYLYLHYHLYVPILLKRITLATKI